MRRAKLSSLNECRTTFQFFFGGLFFTLTQTFMCDLESLHINSVHVEAGNPSIAVGSLTISDSDEAQASGTSLSRDGTCKKTRHISETSISKEAATICEGSTRVEASHVDTYFTVLETARNFDMCRGGDSQWGAWLNLEDSVFVEQKAKSDGAVLRTKLYPPVAGSDQQ